MIRMRVLFVEPPKEYWFVIGEYLPPPYGLLQLAAYLESKNKDVEIEVLDCNAKLLRFLGQKIEGTFLKKRNEAKSLLVYGYSRYCKPV